MALQGTEQGNRPPASAAATADPHPIRRPVLSLSLSWCASPHISSASQVALGGVDCAKRSAVAGLPDDALVEILSRLPAKPLCRFKCVAKAWCDLITDRLRCRKLPQTLQGFFYGAFQTHTGDGCGYGFGCEDGDEGGSEDSDECTDSDKSLSRRKDGYFINLQGRSVPLVDPSFSFLKKLPGIQNLTLLDSCNGLLLFGHTRGSWVFATPCYIVCNPATEHWVLVPRSGVMWMALEESLDEESNDDNVEASVDIYLMFDPAVSLHFQLIELCHTPVLAAVRTYSSETERWSDRLSEWKRWKKRRGEWDLHKTITSMRGSTFLNKMLHLIVSPLHIDPELIVAVNRDGKACRIIRWIEERGFPVFVGQSKGLLHCMTEHMTELSIWVLEDYDAEEWNLKHTVSFSELFGKTSCQFGSDYNVATIHPDHNVVFLVQHWNYKLISYDMDRKEVCFLRTVVCDYGHITLYVPYFSESPVLSMKH